MSDKNLVSLAGDGSGVVWITRGDAPAELLFAADVPGMRELRLRYLVAQAGAGIADVLKLSGVSRLRVIVDSIDAKFAAEDAIDINHCTDCEVLAMDVWAGQKYVSTIKGASKNIRLVIARLYSHGGETDIDLGNFSDQGNGNTTGVSLNIARIDSFPVKVRCLSAAAPTLENTGSDYEHPQRYDITKLNQGWFYLLYNFFKDLLRSFGLKL